MNTVQAYIAQHYASLPLAELGIGPRLSSSMLTPRFEASRHVIFLLFAEGKAQPALVAKVDRLTGGSGSLAHEAQVLRLLQAARPGGFDSAPRVIAFEQVDGHAMLIETAIPGIHMKPAVVRKDPAGCARLAIDWLVELQQVRAATQAADWREPLVAQPLKTFERAFPVAEAERRMLAETQRQVESLGPVVLHPSVEHGDLSHPNLFIRPTGGFGVVDWELARMDGLGVCDLYFFLSYVAFSLEDANKTGDYLTAFQRAFFGPDAWAVPHVLAYAQRADLARALLAPLFVLCWARYTNQLVQRLHAGSADVGPLGAATADWVRANRYYALWRHSLDHTDQLGWSLSS